MKKNSHTQTFRKTKGEKHLISQSDMRKRKKRRKHKKESFQLCKDGKASIKKRERERVRKKTLL